MSKRQKTLIAGLLAVMAHTPGTAQTLPIKQLIEQGRYWQSKGDDQRAAESWGRVLRSDPDQPDALYGLAMIEIGAKRMPEARKYLAQLKRIDPNSSQVASLEQEITLRAGSAPQELDKAREAAQSGDAQAAVEQYKSALGGKAPQGQMALEYYQTLGYTDKGWDEARRGLEQLAKQSPNDYQVKLALAQLLINRESTRKTGIAQLAQLAQRPDIGGAATESWRMALTWLGSPPRPADVPLLQAYLKAHPDDAELRKQMTAKPTAQASGPAAQTAGRSTVSPAAAAANRRTAAAFKAIEGGDLVTAETELQAVLDTSPNDADALGGMGVIRLRQEKFVEARDLLQRASRQNSGSRWNQVLDSANYWALVQQATAANKAGNNAEAVRFLNQAIKIDPKETTAENILAGVQADMGQLDSAERTYRSVLARRPDDADASRGLVNVLSQNGKANEALSLAERMSPEQQNQIGSIGKLRARKALETAKQAGERGDDDAARTALQDALLYDPTDPWLRLTLARLYLKTGAIEEARGLVTGLLQSNGDMPDALYASALIDAETRDWQHALASLQRIPERSRTPAILALQRRVTVFAQTDTASALAKQGRRQEAYNVLAQAEPAAQQDTELLAAIATSWADAGDNQRAIGIMRQLISRNSQLDVNLQLQYGWLLLRTKQDVELSGVLRQLQTLKMTSNQMQTFQELRNVYTVRQADILRGRGDLVGAYDVLKPVLAARPDDSAALGALARMYADSGDNTKALDIYKKVVADSPDNVDNLLGAANVAAQAKNQNQSDAYLDKALSLAPQNAEVLGTAARIYRAQGRTGKAEDMLKAALALQQGPATQAAQAATGAADTMAPLPPPIDDNPFLKPGQVRPAPSAPPAALRQFQGSAVPALPTVRGNVPDAIPSPVRSAPAPVAAPVRPMPVQYVPAPAASQEDRMVSRAAAASVAALPLPAIKVSTDPWSVNRIAAVPVPLPLPLNQSRSPNGEPMGNVPQQPIADAVTPAAGSSNSVTVSTLQGELAEIQDLRSPVGSVAGVLRTRKGEDGLSKLTDVQAPIEFSFPVGDGKAAIRVTPVTLSAGTVGTDYFSSSRFGGGPVAAAAQSAGTVGANGSQRQTGTGLALAYTKGIADIDIGTSPLGFEHSEIVGGVKLSGNLNETLYNSLNLQRRSVTDSLLSFAGTRDDRTGQSWGGVTATGGRYTLGSDNGRYGMYGSIGYQSINGTNVADNSRVEGGLGIYRHLINDPGTRLTTGVNLTALSYDKNLRYFTYGQGGYFSPQQFLALSVPLVWAQRQEDLSYQLGASLGIQHFREDSSNYFPSDAAMQAAAASAAAAQGGTAVYGGQSKTGVGYAFNAAMEYRLSPQLFMGGSLGMDNASDYRQIAGKVYLRYRLEPSTRPMALPVVPVKSPFAE